MNFDWSCRKWCWWWFCRSLHSGRSKWRYIDWMRTSPQTRRSKQNTSYGMKFNEGLDSASACQVEPRHLVGESHNSIHCWGDQAFGTVFVCARAARSEAFWYGFAPGTKLRFCKTWQRNSTRRLFPLWTCPTCTQAPSSSFCRTKDCKNVRSCQKSRIQHREGMSNQENCNLRVGS